MRALPLADMRSCLAATIRSTASGIAGRLGQAFVGFLAVLLLVFAFPQQALAESAACTALNSDFGNGATITITPPTGSVASRDEAYGATHGDAEDFEVGETITWSASSSNSGNENIYFTLGSNANPLIDLSNAGGTEFNESGSFQLNDSVDGVILTVYAYVDNSAQNPPSSLDFSVRCDGVAPPVPEPTITSIVPSTGAETGGTTVTITGTDLTDATTVTFGGTASTNIAVDSDTQITAVTPAGTVGPVDVSVTTPGGTATETGGFTYLAGSLPALSIDDVSAVETDSGSTFFTFNVQLDQPAPAGGVTFDVATADGTATAGDDYAALSITGVTIGPASFAAPITVQVFGDTIPEPDETFFVNITNVTNATIADGQGLGTIEDDDTASPTITGISPATGPEAGGTTVTITGTNLTGANAVTFGGIGSTDVTVDSDTQITAVSPAGTVGAVDVAVTTPGGTVTEAGGFTYEALPVLTISDVTVVEGTAANFTISLDRPASSPVTMDIATADGTAIAGEDYEANSVTGVTIGPGMTNRVFSRPTYDDSIPEPDETFFVNVTNVTGATVADAQGMATIQDNDASPPTITGASPNTGPAAGGTTVTITGTNLTGATDVTFGGTAATNITVVNATQVTAVTPAGTAGAVDVALTTPGGSATLTGGFTYTAATLPELSIDDVTVNEGDGNALFTITLSAPAGPGGVTFDLTTADGTAIAGDDYHSVDTSTSIPEGVDTYYHAAGLIDDAIEEPDETFFFDVSNIVGATLAKARGTATIVDDDASIPPTITEHPANAAVPPGVNTSFSVTATGATGYQWQVDSGAGFTSISDNARYSGTSTATLTITGVTDGMNGYQYRVIVTGAASPAAVSNAATLTILPAPSITGISPVTGPAAGGTTVTITGTNFVAGATTVAFGSNPATSVTVVNAGQITAVTPAGSAGSVDVSVTVPGGSATWVNGFIYEAQPTVSSVAVPANGYYRAGDTLSFTVNFSANVVVDTSGGTPRMALTIGATTRYANYIGGSGTNTLVFRHVVNAGDQDMDGIAVGTIDANGGTIATAGGTPANLTLNNVGSTSNVFVYTAEPTVLSTQVTGSPPSNATSVTFEVVFSEAVTGLTLGDLSLTTTGTAAATLADLQTSDNITYTVAANGITGAGTLRLDVVADAVANIAGTGNPAYSGGTQWAVGPSDDAALASLAPSAGALDPAFGPATTAYDVAVDNATDSITLTPTAADADATITVAGQAVASGSASQAIALAVGATAIPVVVTAEDNTTTRTYTVTVTRAASTDATLADLTPSAGALDPAFDPATTAYDVAVDNATNSITLTPTATEANATITVAGQAVTSGNASQAIPLAVGTTAIPVVVTAEDNTTTRTYTVTVTRAVSTDATLASLVPSAGALDPAFDPATTDYAVAVDNATDSITLTPTATAANATITVNGQTVASGSASQAIAIMVGTTAIPVVVTAEDNTTTRTYTVTVTRAASADATLSGLVPSAGALDPAFDPATTGYDIAADNAADSITLTPTATAANATITVAGQTVASGSASQAIALAVGTTAIPVVVTAEDGVTTRTYTVAVTRAASTNARLSGLTPSAGTLNPAFSADTLDYDVAVANAVDSLTLTPTADGAGATIAVDGQTVASGSASQAIALAVGTTAIPVVVAAEDGVTTRTYTVTVERAQPVPTVISRTVEINAGDTASLDLTEGASGSPFTDAAIIDLSNADAGTARIERDGQAYRLVFASSPTYAGSADLRFTLSNATGTSAPGTITFTIVGRPDPSQDPEVIGLLTAQADSAKRFAQVQTRNFNDRLEQLHDEGDRRRNSMNVRLGLVQPDRTSRAEREIQRMIENGHGANAESVVPGLLAYGPEGANGAGSSSRDEDSAPAAAFASPDLGSFAIWTGGFVNFGERENGGIDIDHTMVGLSGGVDYRFSDKFVAGFGAGYGRDRSDIGVNGTESRASAYSAAIYGSYKPFRNFFIDGLIGGSWLDFDSNRYITSTGDFAAGSRSGRQLFGSLTAAYDFRDDTWLISPYGRIEFSRSWLDGFTERSGGSMALRYGDQTIDSVSGVLGLRAEYTFVLDWGTLTPGARIEYTHDFVGSSRAHLGYADLGGLPYLIEIEPAEQNYATLGLSLDAALPQDWSLGFDYRTSLGRDQQDHAFGLRVGKRF